MALLNLLKLYFLIYEKFKEMVTRQSVLSAEGADDDTKYWELVWANLGCGLTSVTGFCTAINPIDFALWSLQIFILGMCTGVILISPILCCKMSKKIR